jgi:exonuclease VII large subunit
LGELELKKKEILDRLTKENLLEPNKKLFVPMLPQTIGLITSKGSAACNDILKTFSSSGFGFKILLADATVQGVNTENQSFMLWMSGKSESRSGNHSSGWRQQDRSVLSG